MYMFNPNDYSKINDISNNKQTNHEIIRDQIKIS